MMNPVPWTFIRERTPLSWREAALGYHNQWFVWPDAVEMACERLSGGDDGAAVVELAGLSKVEAHLVGELLDKLTGTSVEIDELITKDKWLYLRLAWLFENRATVSDPLEEVEEIYANFDYPEDVAPFVRYMPVADGYDPSAHSADENHLMKSGTMRWRTPTHYLDGCDEGQAGRADPCSSVGRTRR